MASLLYAIRLLHVLAGVGWFGEVLTVNVALLPALARMSGGERARMLERVGPRVFRLAAVPGAAALGSGVLLVGLSTLDDPTRLWRTQWGQGVLTGALLGGVLYMFHLVQEPRLERSLEERLTDEPPETGDTEAALRVQEFFFRSQAEL